MNSLLTISVLGIIAMLSEFFKLKKLVPFLVFAGIAVAIFFCYEGWNLNGSFYNDMVRTDNYAIAFSGLILVLSFLWFMMAGNFFKSESSFSDHYAIILFTICGAIVMTMFANLAMLFIGIEILSVSLYILAASNKTNLKSNEAGMKYFLMGSFATGFLLFGMALIYGVSGTLNTSALAEYVQSNALNLPLMFYVGLLMLMVGLFFKVSAVPFHFWAPDVYEGSPVLVTSFMATIVKTAAFAAFFRLFSNCFTPILPSWSVIVISISGITMLAGNILALSQTSLKRMLAYSGISHAGYMLMAVLTVSTLAAKALLLYTAAYSVAGLAAFSAINAIAGPDGDVKISNLKGFSKDNKNLAFVITVMMLSMAGIPPVAGFFAKYFMFYSAIEQSHIALVVIAVISSLIGVYYYLKVVINIYSEGSFQQTVATTGGQRIFFIITLLLTLILGFIPSLITDLI